MKDMKIVHKPEEKSHCDTMLASGPREDYPYGLQIRLDNDSIDKLAMSDLPDVGVEMTLSAIVKITSKSIHECEGRKHKSLELQITSMELGKKDSKEKDPAKNLYEG